MVNFELNQLTAQADVDQATYAFITSTGDDLGSTTGYDVFNASLTWSVTGSNGWKDLFQFKSDATNIDDLGQAEGAMYYTNKTSFLGQSNDGTVAAAHGQLPGHSNNTLSSAGEINLMQEISTDGEAGTSTDANAAAGVHGGSIGDDFARRCANFICTGQFIHTGGALDLFTVASRTAVRTAIDETADTAIKTLQGAALDESSAYGIKVTESDRQDVKNMAHTVLAQLLTTSGGRTRVSELLKNRVGGTAGARDDEVMNLLAAGDTIQFQIKLNATNTSGSDNHGNNDPSQENGALYKVTVTLA